MGSEQPLEGVVEGCVHFERKTCTFSLDSREHTYIIQGDNIPPLANGHFVVGASILTEKSLGKMLRFHRIYSMDVYEHRDGPKLFTYQSEGEPRFG